MAKALPQSSKAVQLGERAPGTAELIQQAVSKKSLTTQFFKITCYSFRDTYGARTKAASSFAMALFPYSARFRFSYNALNPKKPAHLLDKVGGFCF